MSRPLATPARLWGAVTEILPGMIEVSGISHAAGIGDAVTIEKPETDLIGEVITVTGDRVKILMYSSTDAIRIGDRAFATEQDQVEVGDHWLGALVNYRGEVQARRVPQQDNGHRWPMPLQTSALPPSVRKPLGKRLHTGLNVTDTLLPICAGQRIGNVQAGV